MAEEQAGKSLYLDWLIDSIILSLGVALLFSKRFSHLRILQLYVFNTLFMKFVYTNYFHTWDFYIANNVVGALLYALAYWEVNRKLEKRNTGWVWPISIILLTIPFWPVVNLSKSIVPFALVNLFIAFDLGYAFKQKKPILLHWTAMGSFALAIAALKLLVPSENELLAILRSIEMWPGIFFYAGLLLIVIWQPVMAWLAPKLKPYLPNTYMNPVPATAGTSEQPAGHADVISFPGSQQKLSSSEMDAIRQVSDDMDLLEPLLMSATRLISLSNKPFLNLEELEDFLDLDEEQIEAFLRKYDIKKFHLLEGSDRWVVRRNDVENIPSGGPGKLHTH